MDYKDVIQRGDHTQVRGLCSFGLKDILESGQCFRWTEAEPGLYCGVACGRYLELRQQEDTLTLYHTTSDEFLEVWHTYFDFQRDYTEMKELLTGDPALRDAVAFCPGMRVLRQPLWETLCSFIISQNNNIPRIKGIVERLCTAYGKELSPGVYDFPPPQRLAELEEADLKGVGTGFRAKYLLDAAKKVASGALDLESLRELPLEEASGALQTIKGVGPKVAACVLLYGYARGESIPVDVWIDRALREFYPDGFPEALAPWGGLAQQYLFHYIRLGYNKPREAATV